MAKLATLIDDFSDGVIGGLWTVYGNCSETLGRLQLVVRAIDPIALVQSVASYDMVDSSITVHFPAPTGPGVTGNVQSGFSIVASPNDSAGITKGGNNLIAYKIVGGVQTDVWTAAYNPTTMVYWRLRESAGIFYWELSQFGTSWTAVFSATTASLFSVSNVTTGLFAASPSGEALPLTAQYESVNLGLLITGSGASTSDGTANLTIKYALTASGASTSSGSAAITIPPLTAHALTASGSSTSSGSASIIVIPVVASTLQISASGSSTSDGSANLLLAGQFTASGLSVSNGSAAIEIVYVSSAPRVYTFQPPIVHDLPRTLPGDPRNRLAKWYNPLPRGRSVLKYSNEVAALFPSTALYPSDSLFPRVQSGSTTYTIIDTPTSDQMAAATFAYQGGHIYTIDSDEANELLNAGFSVTLHTRSEEFILTPGNPV